MRKVPLIFAGIIIMIALDIARYTSLGAAVIVLASFILCIAIAYRMSASLPVMRDEIDAPLHRPS